MTGSTFRTLWRALPGDRCMGCPDNEATWRIEVFGKWGGLGALCDPCMEHYKNPGWVYFIRAGDRVKIGYSNNVERRLASLKTGSPVPLDVWHKIPGSQGDERAMHMLFADERETGEWFRVSDRITAFVEHRA